MIDYLTVELHTLSRLRTLRITRLAVVILAALLAVVTVARAITSSSDTHWILLSLYLALAIGWAVYVPSCIHELRSVNDTIDKMRSLITTTHNAADALRAIGIPEEMLQEFLHQTTDDTPDPATAPDDDARTTPTH